MSIDKPAKNEEESLDDGKKHRQFDEMNPTEEQ